jgi:hypothetical protein
MYYQQGRPGGRDMSVHCATSDNGIAWELGAVNPLFSTGSTPNSSPFWWTRVLRMEDTDFLFVEINYRTGTAIYVTTRAGELNC